MAAGAPNPSRKPAQVTAADIAWCGGGKPPWRHNWAKAGRLKAEPPFTKHDAVETAVAVHLVDRVGGKKATAAWDLFRSTVRKLVLGDADLWLVIASQGPRHAAVEGPAEAAETARTLGVPCWILRTDEVAADAKSRYAELLANADAGLAAVTPLGARKAGQ